MHRKFLTRFSVAAVLIVLLSASPTAPAALLITLEEKGADVELTMSGSLTFTEQESVLSEDEAALDAPSAAATPTGFVFVESLPDSFRNFTLFLPPNLDEMVIGSFDPDYTAVWGTTTDYSGDFLLLGTSGTLYLDATYTSGAQISGSGTFSNRTLVEMQFFLGSFLFKLDEAGGLGRQITVRTIYANNVPSPATPALLGAGLIAAIAGRVTRKR